MLGEGLRRRALQTRYARRREMAKEDISTVAEALHRRDGRAEAVPQDVGAEIVDRNLVVLLLPRLNGGDRVVGVQRALLITERHERLRSL